MAYDLIESILWQHFVHYIKECINTIQILELEEKRKKIFFVMSSNKDGFMGLY